jgi:predicted Fe-S protein YdhL (DUF1289 family)
MSSSEVNPKATDQSRGLSPADVRLQKQAARVLQNTDEPLSPCISVCRMVELSLDQSNTSYCVGCWRTLHEIATWGNIDTAGKREVWRLIDARLTARELML